MSYTAAVVGLGNIGQGYDYDSLDPGTVLTHAKSFQLHPGFQLIGAVDPSPEQRQRFEARYLQPAFASLEELTARLAPDVIAVATPTEFHATVFARALESGPKAIVCEKPLAPSLPEAREMVSAAATRGCSVLVNYMRRFEPGMLALRAQVLAGQYGDIIKAVVWYSRGFLNNGSHFVDLFSSWFGAPTAVNILSKGTPHGRFDWTIDCVIRFGGVDVYFLGVPQTAPSPLLIELAIVGTHGIVRVQDGGMTITTSTGTTISSDFARYQWHVADALFAHLSRAEPLASDGPTALGTLSIIDDVFRRLQENSHG